MTNFGPTGEIVYNRTYSRVKPDGTNETWPETVERVVDGNLALVDEKFHHEDERDRLIEMMNEFKIMPAGRHLWASGVRNAQHLFNCWVAGFSSPEEHFRFTFLRLMEGGGVGANYSQKYLDHHPRVQQQLEVHIVCDANHEDYLQMVEDGIVSQDFGSDWTGAYMIEDSREGWATALADLIETHYRTDVRHTRRVYDVSRVRPAGAKLKTFGGRASGPGPLALMLKTVAKEFNHDAGRRMNGLGAMAVDHAIAKCVVAGGVRRSARMSIMHWADPQIEEFINIKATSGEHWTTNISVEVDDEFWTLADESATEYGDQHGNAAKVLKAIAQGMARNGEPGFWDSDLSNHGEPSQVVCTNPCGEITLQEWEPCNLGHINLAAFVNEGGRTNHLGLTQAHRLMTRFLIRATFSPVEDPKSREVLDRNRRIGVGHFGVASFLALTGKKYSEAPLTKEFRGLIGGLADVVTEEAREYSHQLRIPVPVKLRTVAPTGTIAKLPGVSEGIHPIFSRYFIRRVRFNKLGDDAEQVKALKQQGYLVEDDMYAPDTFVVSIPTKDSLLQAVTDLVGDDKAEETVQSVYDLTLTEMLTFQAMYQAVWADNAVSYTANIPQGYDVQVLADTITEFGGALKGMTVFPDVSMPQTPYQQITKEEYEKSQTHDISDGVDEECCTGACPVR